MGNHADPYPVKPRLVGALIKGADHSQTLETRKLGDNTRGSVDRAVVLEYRYDCRN